MRAALFIGARPQQVHHHRSTGRLYVEYFRFWPRPDCYLFAGSINTKVDNVAAKGSKAIIIANNGGIFESSPYNATIPAIMVDTADSDFLVNQIKASADIKVSFPQEGGIVTITSTTGGLSSPFSNHGPTVSGSNDSCLTVANQSFIARGLLQTRCLCPGW